MKKGILIFIITMILVVPEMLIAAGTGQNTMPASARVGAAFWFTLAIVYLSRKRAIGGWLLYYYCCLYAGIFFAVIISIPFINNFSPSNWEDKTVYFFYLTSIIPSNVVLILEMIFATKLLSKKKRNLSNVNVLRFILLTAIVFNLISLFIDAKYFTENIILSVWGLITSIIWCVYFYDSKRVRWVLVEDKWDYTEFSEKKDSNIVTPDKSLEDLSISSADFNNIAFIKSLVKKRIQSDPIMSTMGNIGAPSRLRSFREGASDPVMSMTDKIDTLSDTMLMGLPEATIVTIVETYLQLKRQGISDTESLMAIESHRASFSDSGILPSKLTLSNYIKYRVGLEHSHGTPITDEFVETAIKETIDTLS